MLRDRRVALLGGATLVMGLGSWVAVVHVARLALDRAAVASDAEANHLLSLLALGNGAARLPIATLGDMFGHEDSIMDLCFVIEDA